MTASWLDSLFGAAGAPSNATYITVSLDATLTAERALVCAAGQLSGSDGGAGGSYTIGLATTAVTPGSYSAPSITIDAYGRITAASAPTDIEMSASANRVLSVAMGAAGHDLTVVGGGSLIGAGGDTIVMAPDGATDDGSVLIKDASGNVAVEVGGHTHGAALARLAFFGETPTTRQTVDWLSTDDATLRNLMGVLVTMGLIAGTET